jgi:outer membrane protein
MNVNAQTAWTLDDCIKYAVEHNFSIKQREIRLKAEEVDLTSAKTAFLPDLNASAGQNWNFGRTQTSSGLYENQTQSNTSFSVGSSMPIFTGFRLTHSLSKAKLDLQATIYDMQKAKDDIKLQVISLFLQVLFQKEILKIAENQFISTKQQVEKTKVLVQNGKVPQSQLFDIKSQMASDTLSIVQAVGNQKLALLDLAQSLELQEIENFDIDYQKIDAENNLLQNSQCIYNQAINSKSEIKSAETSLKSAEKSLSIAKSHYYPTISLSAGIGTNYFYLYNASLPNTAFANQLKNNLGEYIGLSFNIPIFNRLSVINGEKQAKFNIENQKLVLENAKKQLFKEIQTAYLNAVLANEKQNAANQAVNAAQEAFRYTKERYENGKSSVFEFSQALAKLSQTQSEKIQAKFDYIFKIKVLEFYENK